MAYERSEKIKRFKEMKQIETQLEQMSLVLDTVKPELVDEETRRKTFNTFIKYWINKAVDDLKVIEGNFLNLIYKSSFFFMSNLP